MTELMWEGKYKDGKKVAPVRIALPFQTIETINESAEDRNKRVSSLFQNKQETEWRNRLIWGDKKFVLPSLLPEFAGKINLIYIDPPFKVESNFSFKAQIGQAPNTKNKKLTEFLKEPNIIEQKAYRDTWGKGLDSYMQWFYETIILCRELLAETGSIYIHLDWRVSQYSKVILDEVFGYNNFINEIVWCYSGPGKLDNGFTRKHDIIFYYSKNENQNIHNLQRVPHKSGIHNKGAFLGKVDNDSEEYIKELEELGKRIEDWWIDIYTADRVRSEKVNYPTQKPEALLERIINASSNEGDLVLDCFCGSGTTAATSEKLNRRWITCDLGRFAIHTARKRLLGIENVKPFIVQNLGKYERQQWMNAEFENPTDRINQEKNYRHFINELYKSTNLDGYMWIHGAMTGRMIHIGSVDSPITVEDIKQTILEFWKIIGKENTATSNGIDFLGWDFAFNVNETAIEFANSNKVNIRFKKIPREVLEKKAVEQGDIKFYELASLQINTKITKQDLKIKLENFIIPPDDVPEDIRENITHWSQWIDYWSIDWNYKDDTFHNEWQSYRTKQNPKIELETSNLYETKGKYTVLVKVIDILGNDTTKSIQIEI